MFYDFFVRVGGIRKILRISRRYEHVRGSQLGMWGVLLVGKVNAKY